MDCAYSSIDLSLNSWFVQLSTLFAREVGERILKSNVASFRVMLLCRGGSRLKQSCPMVLDRIPMFSRNFQISL